VLFFLAHCTTWANSIYVFNSKRRLQSLRRGGQLASLLVKSFGCCLLLVRRI
jgi:uncharacterized membrane protein YwaF